MLHFATNLFVLRALKKRSQDVVAVALEVKRSTYAGWEQGISQPSLEKLILLAQYHRVTLDHLLITDLARMGRSDIELIQRTYHHGTEQVRPAH